MGDRGSGIGNALLEELGEDADEGWEEGMEENGFKGGGILGVW